MLRLTKKADYSLIALRHFAGKRMQGGPSASASAKDVSESCNIPLPVLSKLLQKLGKSGFLTAEHGTNGGYRLSRDPKQISALEVIRAIDGPIVLANCFTTDAACGHSGHCTVKRPLRRIHEGILRLLDGVSIQDMLVDDGVPPSDPGPRDNNSRQGLVTLKSAEKAPSIRETSASDFSQFRNLSL